MHLNDPTSHKSGLDKAIRLDAHQVQLTGAMLDVPLKTLLSIEQSGCFNVFEERKNSVIESYSKLYDEYRSRVEWLDSGIKIHRGGVGVCW